MSEAIPDLVFVGLLDGLADPQVEVRQEARNELVRHGAEVVHRLLAALNDERPSVRWEVAKALSEIHDPETAELLAEALGHPDEAVRWVAADALAHSGVEGFRATLHAIVRRCCEPWVRHAAEHAIHEVADRYPGAVQVLEALRGHTPGVAPEVAASRALRDLEVHENAASAS